MDEPTAIMRARRMARGLTLDQVRLPIREFLQALQGVPGSIVVRFDDTLDEQQAGYTMPIAEKQCIVINENDRAERQRFTVCHEVAHIELGLPTEHEEGGGLFAGRSPNEILCDVFAAELLLPSHLARPIVEDLDLEFESVEYLARQFGASLSAAGSRFAALCDRPCALVLVQQGVVRYASRSKSLREKGAFVGPRKRVPAQSMAAQLQRQEQVEGPIEIHADEWFEDWRRGGTILEDARHSDRWNHTLSLLWFEDDDLDQLADAEPDDDGELLLEPLDGQLPWPGKRRRR